MLTDEGNTARGDITRKTQHCEHATATVDDEHGEAEGGKGHEESSSSSSSSSWEEGARPPHPSTGFGGRERHVILNSSVDACVPRAPPPPAVSSPLPSPRRPSFSSSAAVARKATVTSSATSPPANKGDETRHRGSHVPACDCPLLRPGHLRKRRRPRPRRGRFYARRPTCFSWTSPSLALSLVWPLEAWCVYSARATATLCRSCFSHERKRRCLRRRAAPSPSTSPPAII